MEKTYYNIRAVLADGTIKEYNVSSEDLRRELQRTYRILKEVTKDDIMLLERILPCSYGMNIPNKIDIERSGE
jgi:hypothetical protein